MAAFLCLLAFVFQPPATALRGVVLDASGAPVAGAIVRIVAGAETRTAVTAADGHWTADIVAAPPLRIAVSAPGFAESDATVVDPAVAVRTRLEPQGIAEHVTVSGRADQRLAVSSSATIVDRQTLAAAPALTVDDQLRLVPGFSLFRRTSSRVANPTTQGVTLRGLLASGASRTLVVADGVPLNDPFGSWVYWDRIPAAAIDSIEVTRGAASDVHGNDALGGVIRLTTRSTPGGDVRAEAGGQGTARVSAYGGTSRDSVFAGGALEALNTDGYVVVAPESRGPIDVPAGVTSRSYTGWTSWSRGMAGADVRAGYAGEDRGNGTPAQVNATIARWAAAGGRGTLAGGVWEARLDWTGSSYRQTFSAVAASRATERLTSLQWVAASSTGATVSWLRAGGRATFLASASTRSWRADLDEASISLAGVTSAITRTPPAQRSAGGTVQARFALSPAIEVETGLRVDTFRSWLRDGSPAPAATSAVEPRASISWRATPSNTLRVSWLSGFRAPTMNELYRGFRVGNAITMANADLDNERVWGPEVVLTSQHRRWTGRGIFYATHLTNAIYSRTLSTGATILRQRSNADARALGAEAELEWRAAPGVTVASSWAFSDSRFVAGDLDGKRIPQVPRVQGSIGGRLAFGRLNASADVRVFGRQFDDDVNAFALGAGSITNARIGWSLARPVEVFGAVENAFDADIDTGRTPIRTVGTPRVARAGIRVRFD